MPELICADCIHYYPCETDPTNLTQKLGECRHSPPQLLVLPVAQQMTLMGTTQIQVNVQPVYPRLNPEWLACGQHQERGL